MKISKQNWKRFFIGVFTVIVINLIWDWEENIESFKKGFKAGYESVSTTSLK